MAKRKGPIRTVVDAPEPETPERAEDETELVVAPDLSSDEYGEEEDEGGLELSSESDDDVNDDDATDDDDDVTHAGDDDEDGVNGDVEADDGQESEEEEEEGLAEIGQALGEYVTAREINGGAADGGGEEDEEEMLRVQGAAELGGGDDVAEGNVADLAMRGKGGAGDGAEEGRPDGTATGRVPAAEESDSSEDERPNRNTVGNVPLEWYKDEEHIGYDREGRKMTKKERKDRLDAFLEKSDNDKSWRKVYDEYNDEEVELSKEEIRMIRRIREGRIPHAEVNPYEPYVDWFQYEDKGQPLNSGPEPKRRFIPSKWEAKAVVKLVRAMRKGWIKLEKAPEKPRVYLLWGDDLRAVEKTANGLSYIAAPKPKLPGHEESYNPPVEYVPSEEEVKGYDLMYEEDRPKFIPRQFDSLRQVPAYSDFIKEQFERCLDLYLCPRARRKRINIDPESLVPKLPNPRDLQPFPSLLSLTYEGHTGAVTALATGGGGQWLASGSVDGTVRLWEVQTGRNWHTWQLGGGRPPPGVEPSRTPGAAGSGCVSQKGGVEEVGGEVGGRSGGGRGDLGADRCRPLWLVRDKHVVLLPTRTGTKEEQTAVDQLLAAGKGGGGKDTSVVEWGVRQVAGTGGVLAVTHKHEVSFVTWHHKGDYFASLTPDDIPPTHTQTPCYRHITDENPFKKNHGKVARLLFHPLRPFLFVATHSHVRVYNLAKQQLVKKLTAGANHIASMAVHPGGDNLIVGTQDHRVLWFDLDLSTKPYRSLRNHSAGVTGVCFHNSYPLFASSSADGSAHVFHGRVFADLLQNPLIVPLKILRGQNAGSKTGVSDCLFHPTQPWLFVAREDGLINLFCN